MSLKLPGPGEASFTIIAPPGKAKAFEKPNSKKKRPDRTPTASVDAL
jgi:hypothetical protein